MTHFSHFSRKRYYEIMFFNKFCLPFAMFVCVPQVWILNADTTLAQ